MDFKQIKTLDDLIYVGKSADFSLHLIAFFDKIDDNIVFDSLCYERYSNIIKSKTVDVELTEDQLELYQYNPDTLSTKLYGTPLLYHLILFVNNTSAFKFNKRKIKVIPPSTVKDVILPILTKEEKKINENRIKIMG